MQDLSRHPTPPTDTEWADRLAATSFFNALLRETDHWWSERHDGDETVVIALTKTRDVCLHLRLQHRSLSGRCRIVLPLMHVTPEVRQAISFEQAVEALLDSPWLSEHPLVGMLDDARRDTFVKSVMGSRDTIAAALAGRDDLDHLIRGPLGFLEAEQGLLVGHDFHPAPKSQAPFDQTQAKIYTPEHRAGFSLVWWGVSPARAAGDSSRELPAAALMHDLMPEALAEQLPVGYSALPMHPWQARFLQERDDIAALIDAGELRVLGEEAIDGDDARRWYPTSSHRSLYCPQADWMVKGSLSARLTNSLRVLHDDEVMRGLRLDRWWPQVSDDIRAYFHLMQEPAWLGWKHDDGEIDEASLALLRENRVADAGAPSVVLATLTQPLGEMGQTLLANGVRRLAELDRISEREAALVWFDAFCERVLSPLIRLVVEEGIVLLAHQQNIVVRLERERPVGVDYRDCQGSGVTDHFLARHPGEIVSRDHRITMAMLKRYFPYYVIVNSTLAVTAALGEAGLVDERELVAHLRAHLETLSEQCRDGDTTLLDHLLSSPVLEVKSNFFCYLAGINESTLDDPAKIYLDMPNPLLSDTSTP
ncbi:N2-citryl-N6-acetyl-N6-hydroxylysine synthase [Kushneria avicenniae]|uniref:N2-citryl-N6-acetyl-N6-hydroxylysine synthase n=1 Tax=Kushneria avicenniae TaxID=402385 RepID=A0A1I1LQR7_9GAMM|nr:IucA/IucC family protein [Kushneria avicenniae]SFC75421.1 N2-citryl-N6-acetyl-N6-hydroxylysine synthase [Kushneria avicenniae]